MKAAFSTNGKEVDTTADMDSIDREFSGTVTAYLTRLCGNAELARELTQETFYQAVKSIHRFDGKSSLGTWLCGIARHLYYDAMRQKKPTAQLPEDLAAPGDFTEQLVVDGLVVFCREAWAVIDEIVAPCHGDDADGFVQRLGEHAAA